MHLCELPGKEHRYRKVQNAFPIFIESTGLCKYSIRHAQSHTAVSITLPPLPTSALPLRFSIRSSFHTTVHICSSKLQSPCATVTTPVEYCIFPNSSTAGEKKGGDREFHSRFSETSKRDVGGYGIETNWLVGSIVRSREIFYFLPFAAWKHNNFPFVPVIASRTRTDREGRRFSREKNLDTPQLKVWLEFSG